MAVVAHYYKSVYFQKNINSLVRFTIPFWIDSHGDMALNQTNMLWEKYDFLTNTRKSYLYHGYLEQFYFFLCWAEFYKVIHLVSV